MMSGDEKKRERPNKKALHALADEELFKEYLHCPPNIKDVADFLHYKAGLPLPLYLLQPLDEWLKSSGYRIEVIGSGRTTEKWYAPVQWLCDQGVSVEKACALVKKHMKVTVEDTGMRSMFRRYLANRVMNKEQEAAALLTRQITDNKHHS